MRNPMKLLLAAIIALGTAGTSYAQYYNVIDPNLGQSLIDTLHHRTPATTDYALGATAPVIVAAHRGIFDATHPENTQLSVTNTINHDVEAMELDVYESSDRVPYLMHDQTLTRMTGDPRYSDIWRWQREGAAASLKTPTWLEIQAMYICTNSVNGHGVTVDSPVCDRSSAIPVPSLFSVLDAAYVQGYQGLIFLDLREQGDIVDTAAYLMRYYYPGAPGTPPSTFGVWLSTHVILKFQTSLFTGPLDYFNQVANSFSSQIGYPYSGMDVARALYVQPVYTSNTVANKHATTPNYATQDYENWLYWFTYYEYNLSLLPPLVGMKAPLASLNTPQDDIFTTVWQRGEAVGVYVPSPECTNPNPSTAPSNISGNQGVYIEGGVCGPITPPMNANECGLASTTVFDQIRQGCADHRPYFQYWHDVAQFGFIITDDSINAINSLSATGQRPGTTNTGGAVITPTVLPPTNLTGTPSPNSVTLTWAPSVDPNHPTQIDSSVTQYTVYGGPTVVTLSPSVACSGNTCSATVPGLTVGQQYSFYVVAHAGAIYSVPSATLRFTVLGAPQPYNWSNVVTGGGGGFISGIIFNQKQSGLVYARTDIGGAYRWNSTTNKWVPLLDWVAANDFNTMGVESIATDPVDPNRMYIAAGTYDNYFTNENGAILRSTDQGNTFQRTNLPFKLAGNMPGRGVGERLAIDPNLNSTLYFGATSGSGLWKSTDYGATWNKVQSFKAVGTYILDPTSPYAASPIGIDWVAFDPRTGSSGHASQTIYVGVADLGNNLFKSTDGGQTWSAVAGQPTGVIPHHGYLAASTGMLYICYSNGAGPYDGSSGSVWKLNLSTGAWTNISPTVGADDTYGYSGLTVDAQHPNTIMVSTLNSWWPDAILFRSLDGGSTWSRIWDFTGAYPNRTLRYSLDITAAPWLTQNYAPDPPQPSPKLGWMIESMQIDPFNSDHLLYGTGATMYGTNDLTGWDTGTPIHLSVAAAGIEETSAINLIAPSSGAPLFSVLGDVTGYRHASLTQAPASELPNRNVPPGGLADKLAWIDYAQYYSNYLVATSNVDATQTPAQTGIEYSGDNGVTWTPAKNMPAGATGGGTVAVAASPNRFVWSDPTAGVNVSTDKGVTWVASTGIPIGATVLSDRNNSMKFYGLSAGTFYTSTDGGVTFTAQQIGLPTNGKIKAVSGREGDIWLSSGSGSNPGLWHSTNSGATFTRLANVDSATSVGLGKAASGANYQAIFVGGVIGGNPGFFRSDNGGTTWIRINDDQHQYATTGNCITGDPNTYGRVYVCTNGRGIITGDIQ